MSIDSIPPYVYQQVVAESKKTAPLSFLQRLYLRGLCFNQNKRLCGRIRLPGSVVSVGSIVAGGSGKTPFCALVIKAALEKKRTVILLSRGYGRKVKGPYFFKATSGSVTTAQAGDEPVMLARKFPQLHLAISADRISAARIAQQRLGSVPNPLWLMDDGFQSVQIHRDHDIVLLPPDICDLKLIPSGTLREPLSALARATHILGVGSAFKTQLIEQAGRSVAFLLNQIPLQWVNGRTGQTQNSSPRLDPAETQLVCAIARPDRFIAFCSDMFGFVPKCKIFPDHHRYRAKFFSQLAARGIRTILTTEKDFVKLQELELDPSLEIWYLTIRLTVAQNQSLKSFNSFLDSVVS